MKDLLQQQFALVVIGGGLSGMAAAISAARFGVKTALVQARSVLGGNASSEIRMHICGADHHMSRPNARETGLLEEWLLENKCRNPTNSYAVFDSILWEKAALQPNLTLFLNTCVDGVTMDGPNIVSVTGYQQTTEKRFVFSAPLFVDDTGDGTVACLAGADYTVGREARATYGEKEAPETADTHTMGNSLMFRAVDKGRPVPFVKPPWANTYTEQDLRNRPHRDVTSGYWWIELGGGRYDTIADAEVLRTELMKCVYGVWDHIKNGGDHGAENLDLAWVGTLPGKRESRRFYGDYVLTEKDCEAGARFADTAAYGGWPMDVHTVEGFLNDSDVPTRWLQLKDVYAIPYRCLYSRNVKNLFLAGRIISASHMAFASTRVMGTCAVVGQAIGTAAALAAQYACTPRGVGAHIRELQQFLLRQDCYLPGVVNTDAADLARRAAITAACGSDPQAVANGTARTVGTAQNCWAAPLAQNPTLCIALDDTYPVSQVVLTFDSNLSREITISICDEVLARQSEGTPPELVRNCTVEFWRAGSLQAAHPIADNHQRHCTLTLPRPVPCDTVRLTGFTTWGSDTLRLFEVRIYQK